MRISLAILVSLCALALLVPWSGCVTQSTPQEEPPPERTALEKTPPKVVQDCKAQSDGPILEVELTPAAAGVGRHTLTIFAKDPKSNLFVDTALKVEPWMPLHGHGAPEAPEVKRIFKGKYEVYPVHFSMPGQWDLVISATSKEGKTTLCQQIEVANIPVKDGPSQPTRTIPTDSTAPLLEHPVISLDGPFDPKTKRLGSLLCDAHSADTPCLTPFVLGTGTHYEQAGFVTFVTAPGTLVKAASSGVVESIQFMYHSAATHSDIFRLATRTNKDNAFLIEYRNLKAVQVKVGDSIKAGQTLAEAGDGKDAQHTRISFGVRRYQEVDQRLCPEGYFSDAMQKLFADALGTLQAAGVFPSKGTLCQSKALLCTKDTCDAPASFVAVKGDIDAGKLAYKGACLSCHGSKGEGGIGTDLCKGGKCKCVTCRQSHEDLSRRIALDMPPEGRCAGACADDVAAYIMFAFATAP